MHDPDRLVGTARIVVLAALLANRLLLIAIGLALLLSLVFGDAFAGLVGRALPGFERGAAVAGVRLTFLLGMTMAVFTNGLLSALSQVVASAGDPFVPANARRLDTIGWHLLALQLCELPGTLIAGQFPATIRLGVTGEVSLAGWIAVLMVFVLARVFAVGAAMRDDLAATI